MDVKEPHSRIRIATRIVCTLACVGIIYVVGAGPAWCIFRFTEHGETLIPTLYSPLRRATAGTPLDKPLDVYMEWWVAFWKQHDQNFQLPTGG